VRSGQDRRGCQQCSYFEGVRIQWPQVAPDPRCNTGVQRSNNGTVPSHLMATYAREQTRFSLWSTLIGVEATEAHIRDRHYGRLSPSERPMDNRRLSDHGLGRGWIDLSVALMIAIAAVASWVAAFAFWVIS
jgi:hypothetical protein